MELLVICAIIGILAAIAISNYSGFKAQANDAAMQSAAKAGANAVEAYAVEHGDYVGADAAGILADYGYRDTEGVTVEVVDVDEVTFKVRACGAGGSYTSWVYNSSVGKPIGDSDPCPP
jgi:type II secretory pathway pseudopilin PulG